MSEASKELVSRLFEQVFNRKNFDVCHELVADDYKVTGSGLKRASSRSTGRHAMT